MLAAFAVSSILWVRSELETLVVRQLDADLRDRIEAWEVSLAERVAASAEAAAADPNRAPLIQARLRQDHPWFDSLYVWEPAAPSPDGLRPGAFAFPYPRPLNDRQDPARAPCVVQGRYVRSQPLLDRARTAEVMQRLCQDQPLRVRVVALTDAVHLLLEGGLALEAQQAIEADDLMPDDMGLHQAIALGIPALYAVVLRLEQADIVERLGDGALADELRTIVGFEICALDAPDAYTVRNQLDWVVDSQRADEQVLARLVSARDMAARRVNAYRHIGDNLLTRPAPAEPSARWVYDQYDEESFLLYTRWAQGGRVGVALQVDQDILLEDFLREMRSLRDHIAITNADGSAQVAGIRRAGATALQVPFASTLTHLRVDLRQEAVDARLRQLSNQWALPLVLVGFVVLAGCAGIWAQIRTAREQAALLRRQRDFATRVTHELKTPLAGIKVMAENLELGYFADDRERAIMAAAIVQEADRLTDRVNEILSVTKERVLKAPVPFDPEEPLMQAAEHWAPRLEHAQVQFDLDLEPTDHVVGDAEALRDAVACLLDNALKYAREDADPREVVLSLRQEAREVVIEVVDNGLGVPEDQRAAIFERFHRVEGPNRGLAGGHGLGLAQVAEIVRAHGGTARCGEGLDGGARFTLRLPSVTP